MKHHRFERVRPDHHLARRKAGLACGAVQQLIGMGIDVLSIDLNEETAVIDVAGTYAVKRLHGEAIGQSSDGAVKRVQKSAFFCGCNITWSEQQ